MGLYVAKPVYLCARAAQNSDGRLASLLCSVPPGRAQREPQGYAGLTRLYVGLRGPAGPNNVRHERALARRYPGVSDARRGDLPKSEPRARRDVLVVVV